ncbi:MAG: hypothetical protein Q8O89_07925 [Nanoarchaeota archaeon]|nr:hypothetical protein [Nanoarchaeota archaeon]
MDNMTRAKSLIKSARLLFESEDLTGVAGLSYQAVESAIAELSLQAESHTERRKRAEKLLNISKNSLKELWDARNIDFYGNQSIGGE